MNQPPQPGQSPIPGQPDWMLDTPVPAAQPGEPDPAGATEIVDRRTAVSRPPVDPPVFDYPDPGQGPGYGSYPAVPTGMPSYGIEEPPVSYGAIPLPGAAPSGAAAPAWGYPGVPEEKPARKSRKKWLIAAATVLIVALVGGGIAIYQVFFSGKADREAVGTAATDFTRAVAGGDVAGVKGLLCGSEASAIPDVSLPSGASGVPDGDVQVTLGEVQVRKDLASAVITRGSNPDTTLYLRKEGGAWKVCVSAKSDFDSAAK